MQVTFEQLWAIARRETNRTGEHTPHEAFASVGLRLEPPVKAYQYYCTPKNVKTFASTGCDGVHFSFLEPAGCSLLNPSWAPVVMTIPMNFDNQNIVVGESLYEFLCLGCRVGYEAIELLASSEKDLRTLKAVDYANYLSLEQKRSLHMLSRAFSLEPLHGLEARMRQLQTQYLDYLQMGEVETFRVTRLSPGNPVHV